MPPWTLVIEPGMLSDAAQRDRAVRDGFGVTVQQPLLWNMGSEMLVTWGPERTRQVAPIGSRRGARLQLRTARSSVHPG